MARPPKLGHVYISFQLSLDDDKKLRRLVALNYARTKAAVIAKLLRAIPLPDVPKAWEMLLDQRSTRKPKVTLPISTDPDTLAILDELRRRKESSQ